MKKILPGLAAALLVSAGAYAADVTTTTTWTNDQGMMVREYSTTKHYESVADAKLKAEVGVVLPETVTVHPLPETIKVERPERYSYVILNDHPVVVDRTSRRVIHVW